MKNRIFTTLLAFSLLFLGGCDKFLEESSQDEVRPGSTTDLTQLLLGEGYMRDSYFHNFLDLMTDDVESHYAENNSQIACLTRGAPMFTWQEDMFEQMKLNNQNIVSTVWEDYYEKIKGCNVVLDMIDQVTGPDSEKANLRGQALAMRSFYYFMLVNLYGRPYNAESEDIRTSPGVPLVLSSAVLDEFPARASVYDVYAQIEKDLVEAAPLLERYGQHNGVYKVTDLFAHTLLARMYLYMERWDEAKTHADYVLGRKSGLVRLCDHIQDVDGMEMPTASGMVYAVNSPEIIWGYSRIAEYSDYYLVLTWGQNFLPSYQASDELNALYEYDGAKALDKGDRRVDFYYTQSLLGYSVVNWVIVFDLRICTGQKGNSAARDRANKGMRVAELYLIRAECNIRKYLESGDESLRVAALKDLNFLREHRYDTRTNAYTPVNITGGEQLLQFCKEERRRELSFEDHRWFDLRRYGMPEIRHSISMTSTTTEEHVLPKGGKRYVLPIARTVLERNPALVPNP